MATTDEQIGRNLTRFRGDMSQKDLADKMRALGWKWSQSTVWSIERGDRPLRLAEAEALGPILQIMGTGPLLANETAASLQSAMQNVVNARDDLGQAALYYDRRRYHLALTADRYADELDEQFREQIRDALEAPEDVIRAFMRYRRAEEESELLMDRAEGVDMAIQADQARQSRDTHGPFQKLLFKEGGTYGQLKETS